jgi:PAS domain S-box-containing protein
LDVALRQNLGSEDQSQEHTELPSVSNGAVRGSDESHTPDELPISYRAVLDGTTCPILIANADGQYVEVNAAAVDLLDYSESELLKMTVDDLEARPEWTADGRLHFIRFGRWDGSMTVRSRSGDLIPLDARVSLIYSPSQTLYHVVSNGLAPVTIRG